MGTVGLWLGEARRFLLSVKLVTWIAQEHPNVCILPGP